MSLVFGLSFNIQRYKFQQIKTCYRDDRLLYHDNRLLGSANQSNSTFKSSNSFGALSFSFFRLFAYIAPYRILHLQSFVLAFLCYPIDLFVYTSSLLFKKVNLSLIKLVFNSLVYIFNRPCGFFYTCLQQKVRTNAVESTSDLNVRTTG